MAWEEKPGVRQDAYGRHYKVLVNSRGRQDIQYVQKDTGAPVGYTVPEPKYEVPVRKPKIITTGVTVKRPVIHRPKRLHVVELRKPGSAEKIKEVSPNRENGLAAYIDSCILRFTGKEWVALFPPVVDWHVQYHIDEETK